MKTCNSPSSHPWYGVLYGTPNPRYFRPLVRINGMTEDAPQGYKLDPCMLPPAVLAFDFCSKVLSVNGGQIDTLDFGYCDRYLVGRAVPTIKPPIGYSPFAVDILHNRLYFYESGTWYNIGQGNPALNSTLS